MKVGVASDHAGFEMARQAQTMLREAGHDVTDFGPFSYVPGDDYPDFVIPLAEAVRDGKVERGIAICGSGIGACVAANKVKGVRAGLCADHYSAHQGVEHDNMNVLCLGERVTGPAVAQEIMTAFLAATFTNEERHVRRLAKVAAAEDKF
ncbi:MAG: RpiB/LacA/LacB family sugar-phosphate isomerase [Bryobacteraceae bacterium]